ncbi:response regulator transcription factor [Alkalilimnicola sp. S0819]|nr:response regulator transcription factor [Alkalilimnicola sp. S0819]MPQ15417.1 response regulator [Alkalilimnicola sp. S0819]
MRNALVLEDHDEPRAWLMALLEDAFPGIEVTPAATLGQARQRLTQARFDLAIIDISLPDGSGISLVEELARERPDTYTVVATIFDDDRHLFSALQSGAQGYVLKDQPREQLLRQLRDITQGQPPLSAGIARRVLRHFQRRQLEASPDLTGREAEVLNLLARGFNRSDIAKALGITSNTAAGYIKNIYRKLDVSGRAEATLEAVRRGLVDPAR